MIVDTDREYQRMAALAEVERLARRYGETASCQYKPEDLMEARRQAFASGCSGHQVGAATKKGWDDYDPFAEL